MTRDNFRFHFESDIPLDEAEMSLHLSLFAVEGLFGQARVRLDAGYALDAEAHALVIDASTEVGSAIVRVFTALLVREFGDDAFEVERVDPVSHHEPQEMCA